MQPEDLVNRVSARCPGLDPDKAHDVTVITMRTLAEHMDVDEADRVAAALPAVFAEAFHSGSRDCGSMPAETTLEAFQDQLVMRTEIHPSTASEVARAVVAVLVDTLTRQSGVDPRIKLPPYLHTLRDRGIDRDV